MIGLRGGGALRRMAATGPRRWLVRAAALVLVVGLAGTMARAGGPRTMRVDLRPGGAWVASPTVGLMTLIDGESAQVVARVAVGPPSDDLVAAQAGTTAYAVDGTRGTVARVDPRTFAASAPTAVVTGATGHVVARATAAAVYVFDEQRGRVVVADPRRLVVHGATGASLGDGIGSDVIDGAGRLWLLGARDGDLVWFDGPVRHDRPSAVARPGRATLVTAGGQAAVVDQAARRVSLLDGSGRVARRACLDVAAGDTTVRYGGAGDTPLVYAVSGAQGVLRVSDLRHGGCTATAMPVADPGADLGAPVEVDGYVFVPDYTTGTVSVVDVAHGRTYTTRRPVARGTFQLFAHDGFVFYNDPDTEQAGVIHLDGTFSAVAKYNPADPGDGVTQPGGGGRDRPRPTPAGRRPGSAPGTPPTTVAGPVATRVPTGPGQAGGIPGVTGPPGAPASPASPGSPGDGTRPARPDETTTTTTSPAGGSGTTTTTTTSTSSSTTSSSTTTSTTVVTTTTTSTTTPVVTAPPDSDHDGVPDSADRCPGFNDHNDQDHDGIPDGCDRSDGSPPSVSIGTMTTGRNGFLRTINVPVTVSDPQSGIRSVVVTVSYTYHCEGDPTGQSDPGPQVLTGSSSGTYVATLGCDVANRAPTSIRSTATVTVTNGDGVTTTRTASL